MGPSERLMTMTSLRNKSSISATDLVFGGGPLGGLYTSTPPADGKAAVSAALDAGIVEFDTAPLYGAGQSEVFIGETLRESSDSLRASARVHTKIGRIVVPASCTDSRVEANYMFCDNTDRRLLLDYSRDGVRRSLAASRERLRDCCIDTVRVHDAETPERYAAAISGGCVDELVDARNRGEIASVSLGMNEPEYIMKFLQHYPRGTFDNVLMAGSWNLLDQSGAAVLQLAGELDIDVLNAGVFASGYLCDLPYYKYTTDIDPAIEQRAAGWRQLCAQHGVSLRAAALAFAFLPTVVTRVVLGMRSADEVRQNVALCADTSAIAPKFWLEAQRAGLIDASISLFAESNTATPIKSA